MSSKTRTKKTTGEAQASWREEQRRLRNRLSQKAVRERKAARIQQLEQQLASVTNGGESARVNELLNTNTRLRHALLDTRKKLASLSATAAQLGERIKVALDGHGGQETEQDSDDVANQMDLFDNQEYHLWRDEPQASTHSPPTSSTESITRSHDREEVYGADLGLTNSNSGVDTDVTDMPPIQGQPDRSVVSMEAILNGSKYIEAISNLFPGPQAGLKPHASSGSVFSQHLDHIHGLLRLGGALECSSRSAIRGFNFAFPEDPEPLIPRSMPPVVENMFNAFLEQCWPSVKYWFDVTQSTPLAHRVLWWQTSNSHEAATQVPPGNSPTLIQLSQPKYPSILDWVPHPGLRDRLILNHQSYDVDQVICDMTNSFVVEIEENSRVADEIFSGIPQAGLNKGYSYNLMELVDRTLVFGPLDSQSQQELTVMRLLHSTAAVEFTSMEHPIHCYKLDPRFFDKYPGLYDANAESKYRPKHCESMQKSQLPLPFTMNSAKEYLNSALHSNSTLIRAS